MSKHKQPELSGGNARQHSQRCPICGRPADPAARPFCSPRCADVDLARWFGEVYRVPVTEDDPDDDEDPQPQRF